MKKSAYLRFTLSFFLVFALLSPTAVLAMGDGKKYFKEGKKHAVAEEWDKAAEKFALAVMDNPKNPEYRLHYVRSLFMASQMFMKRGKNLADEGDYAGAYVAYRKAYAYDPVNELAKAQMERMVRLQKAQENPEGEADDVKLVQTRYKGIVLPDDVVVPQKLEIYGDVLYPSGVDLKFIIKDLASKLDLNVLFDSESFRQDFKVEIELRNVTAAKALDYIFLQEGLFFEKVGPRTILVAKQTQRQKFQQLVLRTFYLANASPKDVSNVVKTAIPAQPGRTPTIVLTDEATNSITIRDTAENIKLIGKLIKSLDKDRAEVVMDVAIYEVSKTDLLQFGNQLTTRGNAINFGGSTRSVVGVGGSDIYGDRVGGDSIIPKAFGLGLLIPAVNLIALQDKDNTKLIASTQIHAFNNEDSSARIGQRVPVRTAAITSGFNQSGSGGTGNDAFLSNVFNYEQTGLTLKFKPLVFPNQDVQVAMEIESKEVFQPGETPTFTERTIKGTARIQNNKTLLLASVAQNVESNGRSGIPILGMIPILGRLFTAPTKNNSQTDIVIAITPRVIRAPDILPEDLEERPTGSLAVPTSGSLEAMVIQEEIDEQLAVLRRNRRNKANADVQLPDRAPDEPTYVRTNELPKAETVSAKVETKLTNIARLNQEALSQGEVPRVESKPVIENANASIQTNIANLPMQNVPEKQTAVRAFVSEQSTPEPKIKRAENSILENVKPIDSSVRTLKIVPTAQDTSKYFSSKEDLPPIISADEQKSSVNSAPSAELQILPGAREMKAGEKTRIAVIVNSEDAFRSAVLGLRFDDTKLRVKKVGLGNVFGEKLVYQEAKPFFNEDGKMYVSLSSAKEISQNTSGVLAYVEIEALADGKHEIDFDRDIVNFLTSSGVNFALKF